MPLRPRDLFTCRARRQGSERFAMRICVSLTRLIHLPDKQAGVAEMWVMTRALPQPKVSFAFGEGQKGLPRFVEQCDLPGQHVEEFESLLAFRVAIGDNARPDSQPGGFDLVD